MANIAANGQFTLTQSDKQGISGYDSGNPNLKQEKGRVIDTNMAGRTPRELASEFGEIRRLRPKVGKAVLHVSLSAAIGEKLSDEQWREIGQRYLRGMGFKDNQFVLVRHAEHHVAAPDRGCNRHNPRHEDQHREHAPERELAPHAAAIDDQVGIERHWKNLPRMLSCFPSPRKAGRGWRGLKVRAG